MLGLAKYRPPFERVRGPHRAPCPSGQSRFGAASLSSELLLKMPTARLSISKTRVYATIRICPGSRGFALRVAREFAIARVAVLLALQTVGIILGGCWRSGKSYGHKCRSSNDLAHFHFLLDAVSI
jgi:hypothetical protein